VLAYVRSSDVSRIQLGAGGQWVTAETRVLFAPEPGELRSSQIGALVMLYDLSRAKHEVGRDSMLTALTDWLAIALMAGLIYLLFHFSFNRRIQRLLAGIARLRDGDLSTRLALSGRDELAQVALAVDDMAGQLAAHQRELAAQQAAMTESSARYRALFESSLDGIVLLDETGDVVDANPTFHRHGRKPDGPPSGCQALTRAPDLLFVRLDSVQSYYVVRFLTTNQRHNHHR
jgi:PAS domain-containing protein